MRSFVLVAIAIFVTSAAQAHGVHAHEVDGHHHGEWVAAIIAAVVLLAAAVFVIRRKSP